MAVDEDLEVVATEAVEVLEEEVTVAVDTVEVDLVVVNTAAVDRVLEEEAMEPELVGDTVETKVVSVGALLDMGVSSKRFFVKQALLKFKKRLIV